VGLAGLIALASLAVLGQAAARQFSTDADDHAALSAMGLRARQLVLLGLARAAAIGAPPSMLVGVRYALERGRGRVPVPVGTALLGTVLAVTALSATTVFGASLTRLIDSPALYGVPYDTTFSNTGSDPGVEAYLTGPVVNRLTRDPAIDRVTLSAGAEINVNGRHVRAVAVKPVQGAALISSVDGRLPRGDQDIALGAATLRMLGAATGDTVRVTVTDPVTGAARTTRFRVSGRASFAPSFGTGGFGTGAALTAPGCPPSRSPSPGPSEQRTAPGNQPQAAPPEKVPRWELVAELVSLFHPGLWIAWVDGLIGAGVTGGVS
jgi:hypothetical protein